MYTQVYLVRHGETDYNVAHRFIGSTDMPLNARGQEQAKCLIEPMSKIHLDRIYASPLKRTMMTADCIRANRDIQIIPVDGIKEIHCGQWEGLNSTEIEARWPGQIKLWQFDPGKLQMEDGETLKQVQDRAVKDFVKIIEKEMGHSIGVASHMLTIQLIMAHFLDIDVNDVWRMVQLENTSITTMRFYDDGTFEVLKWGEEGHLREDLKNPSVKIAGFKVNEKPKYDVSMYEGTKHFWKRSC